MSSFQTVALTIAQSLALPAMTKKRRASLVRHLGLVRDRTANCDRHGGLEIARSPEQSEGMGRLDFISRGEQF
jgi:hypothetical protein